MQTLDLISLHDYIQQTPTSSPKAVFVDNDFAIFDSIDQMHIFDGTEPITRLDMAVFAICTSGSCHFNINLREYDVVANTFVVLLRTQVIQITDQSADFSGIFICVAKDMIETIIQRWRSVTLTVFFYVRENSCIHLSDDELTWIRAYHDLLFREMNSKHQAFKKEIAQSLLTALLYETCNIFSKVLQQHKFKKSRQEDLFEQFMHTLSECYMSKHTISFYADRLCVTPKYLSAVVKKVSGRSASDWIDNMLMLEAKVQLKTSNKTIQQISDELSFANQSFFGKFFKQHMGISPNNYRK